MLLCHAKAAGDSAPCSWACGEAGSRNGQGCGQRSDALAPAPQAGHEVPRSARQDQHRASLHPSTPARCQPYAHPRLRGNACWCRFHGALIDSLLPPRRGGGKQVIFSNHPGWKESPPARRGCRSRGWDVAAQGHHQPASARPSLRPHPSTANTAHPRCPSKGCPGHGSREGQMLAPLTSTPGQR